MQTSILASHPLTLILAMIFMIASSYASSGGREGGWWSDLWLLALLVLQFAPSPLLVGVGAWAVLPLTTPASSPPPHTHTHTVELEEG